MVEATPVGDPLRLCVVTLEFPLLSETFVIDQVKAQAERGFQTTVVADKLFRPAGSRLEPDVPSSPVIEPRWRLSPGAVQLASRLPHRARKLVFSMADAQADRRFDKFDVVLAHFGATGARLDRSRARGLFNRPFATIFHGNDVAVPLHLGDMGRYRGLLRRGDLLLPVSDYFRRILIDAGAAPELTVVHRTGVDCTSIPFRARQARGDRLSILTACRFVEKKGIEYALRALADLKTRRPDIAWRYDLIGDGPLQERMRQISEELGLAGEVTFLGPQPHAEVKARLDRADVFLLPSVTAANGDMEGVPVVLMEAMASGAPAVSTVHSGIPELIEDGVSGLLAPERDWEALSRRLETVADQPETVLGMARAARAKIEREFNQDTLNDQLAERLRALAATRR